MGIYWGVVARVTRRDPVVLFLRWRVWRRSELPAVLDRCADTADAGGLVLVLAGLLAFVVSALGGPAFALGLLLAIGLVTCGCFSWALSSSLSDRAWRIRREGRR